MRRPDIVLSGTIAKRNETMRNLTIVTAAALAFGAAACSDRGAGPGNAVEVPGPEAVQNQIASMPEGQRNAVFVRAIRDAGQDCQHVESSDAAGAHQGFPVWNAHCRGGGTWTIVIMNDGVAQVLNAAEAQLIGDNQAAAPNEGR